MKYYIVETDNFDGDYPDEKFVGTPFNGKTAAEAEAARLNDRAGRWATRYFKVVEDEYALRPGFTP